MYTKDEKKTVMKREVQNLYPESEDPAMVNKNKDDIEYDPGVDEEGACILYAIKNDTGCV